jgi:WD40 repeat protein
MRKTSMALIFHSRFAAIPIIAILLSACAPAATVAPESIEPAVASIERVESATPSPEPAVFSPTPTFEPDATRTPAAGGPTFMYLTGKEDELTLNLIGANAEVRRQIPLPRPFETGYCFSCLVSPDGEWLAFWTGSAGGDSGGDPLNSEGPFDLQLNLYHIPDGSVRTVTALLSPDYPANFTKNAEAVRDLSEFAGQNVESIAGDLSSSFLHGILSAAWSPDGRYLAFAGEMDGPSSDLYTYDVTDGRIRQLSSGTANLLSNGPPAIRFSPDGKWIVYSSGYWVGEGMKMTFYAARPDGSDYREYPEAVQGFSDWLSDSAFLVNDSSNGIGDYRLQSADLANGKLSVVWKCPYRGYSIDPQGALLIFASPVSSDWGCEDSGLFQVNLATGSSQRLFDIQGYERPTRVEFLGQGDRRFLVHLGGAAVYAVSATGGINLLLETELAPFASPDGQWAAFAGEGLRIMDSSGTVSDFISDVSIDNLIWRPDSKGFLFISGSDVYSVSMPEKTIVKMEGVQYPERVGDLYWQPDSEGYFFISQSDLYFLSLRDRSMEFVDHLTYSYFLSMAWVAAPDS